MTVACIISSRSFGQISKKRGCSLPSVMSAIGKGITWLGVLIWLSQLDCLWCSEAAFLFEDQDYHEVKGVEDVRACTWIVKQLEDQTHLT